MFVSKRLKDKIYLNVALKDELRLHKNNGQT